MQQAGPGQAGQTGGCTQKLATGTHLCWPPRQPCPLIRVRQHGGLCQLALDQRTQPHPLRLHLFLWHRAQSK